MIEKHFVVQTRTLWQIMQVTAGREEPKVATQQQRTGVRRGFLASPAHFLRLRRTRRVVPAPAAGLEEGPGRRGRPRLPAGERPPPRAAREGTGDVETAAGAAGAPQAGRRSPPPLARARRGLTSSKILSRRNPGEPAQGEVGGEAARAPLPGPGCASVVARQTLRSPSPRARERKTAAVPTLRLGGSAVTWASALLPAGSAPTSGRLRPGPPPPRGLASPLVKIFGETRGTRTASATSPGDRKRPASLKWLLWPG